MSRLGKLSQASQRAKRLADISPDDLVELLANQPPVTGDAIGSIELRSFGTGTVSRWTLLRGTRRNNYILRTPDGRRSQSHGMAWMMTKIRRVILRRL